MIGYLVAGHSFLDRILERFHHEFYKGCCIIPNPSKIGVQWTDKPAKKGVET
jgi:hypothetical protein